MNTAIIVDSTGSLNAELLKEPYIYQVNLTVTFADGETDTDTNNEEDSAAFYQKLNKIDVLPKTSQPDPAQFIEALDDIKAKGFDNVLFIHLASALSGTFQTAQMLAKEYEDDFKSYFIDSKGASFLLENLVEQGLGLFEQNLPIETIVEKLQWVADNTDIFLMVEDLKYLFKGGRLSKGESLVGNLLNIKPILVIGSDGRIEMYEKVRTTKRALKRMNEIAEEYMTKFDNKAQIIFAHANREKTVLKQIGKLQTIFPNATYRQGFLTIIIGSHVGEGAVGFGVIPYVQD